MPILSLNEIRQRAQGFVQEYRDASSESADSQSFWKDFFHVFGINARRVGSFEKPVRNLLTVAGRGRIDYLWKGNVLVEHKSRGEDLDTAAGQARDYFPGLKDNELPRYVVVSDFARFRVSTSTRQPRILPLEILQPARLIHLQPAILSAPAVATRLGRPGRRGRCPSWRRAAGGALAAGRARA